MALSENRFMNFWKNLSDNKKMFLLGGMMGAAFFLLIYGYLVLDFTYTDWIDRLGGDIVQHQTGFEFYRQDAWRFPLGVYQNWGYPVGTSVVYTDSIPIFALLFKLFRGILPNSFQYLGLWGITSFFLQGGLSSIILYRFVKKKPPVLAVLPMFICSSTVLWRMYRHSALGGQWVLLLAIWVYIKYPEYKSLRAKIGAWAAVTSLSVLVHPYFLPMTGFAMFFRLLEEFLKNRSWKECIIVFASSVAATLAVFYTIGGFYSAGFGMEGLGVCSMNLNALFNPFENDVGSIFFPSLPVRGGQYEGYQYLGAGMIFLSAICLFFLFRHIREIKKVSMISALCTGGLVLTMLIFALSPVVTLNSRVLLDYMDKLGPLRKLMAPFRSTGRMFWLARYLLMFGIVIVVCRHIRQDKLLLGLLLCCTVIQIIDLQPWFGKMSEIRTTKITYERGLGERRWGLLREFKHLEFISLNASEDYEDAAELAIRFHMTLNDGNIARKDGYAIGRRNLETIEAIEQGTLDPDTVCINRIGELGYLTENIADNIEVKLVDKYYLYYRKK